MMSSSDLPDPSRPPRDFPSLQLAKVAGGPKGEPLADSLLQSPIIPKAPTAPKIHVSSAIRDVELWSNAPGALPDDEIEELERAVAAAAEQAASPPDPTRDPVLDSVQTEPPREPVSEHGFWQRGMWAAALGVGVGAVLAWLYRFG